MAGVRITVDDRVVVAALDRLARVAGDPGPALSEIGDAMVAHALLRFERQQGPDRRPWAPLAASTIRQRKAPSPLALLKSGRLRASITRQVSGSTLEVGTNTVYAAIHQFGGDVRQGARSQRLRFDRKGRFARATRRRGIVRETIARIGATTRTIPARPFLGFGFDDAAEARLILERRLAEALRGAGGQTPLAGTP